MAESIDEITKEFDIRIGAEQDPEKKHGLELEKSNKINQVLQGQLLSVQRDGWLKEALTTFPSARQREIHGDTRDAIMASAKDSHEDMEKFLSEDRKRVAKETEDKLKKQAWGGGTGGPTPSTKNAEGNSKWADRVNGVWQRLREGTLRRNDEKDLIQDRFGDIVRNSENVSPRLREWGQQGFGRKQLGERGEFDS